MDDRSFDRLARLLGEARDRRTGLKALVGGILGAGGLAALDTDADAKRKGRKDAGPDAGRKKRRKKCDPPCAAGFACVKGTCTCAGVSCGGACCASGQVCRDGACADPRPACLPFGEECKDTGRPCCDGLTCASGQDGSYPVTCLRSKGAACAGDAECPFGMSCTDGRCLGDGGGGVPTGVSCSGGASCAQPGATCSAYTTAGAPGGEFCTLPLRKVCTGNPDCSCYNCWYVQPGVVVNGRVSRAEAPVKACIQPKNAGCTTTDDCALGLTCQNNVCTASGEQCAPAGAPCPGGVTCCQGSTCQNGACTGGGGGGSKNVGDSCTNADTCPTGSTCTLSADPSKSGEGTKCLLNNGETTDSAAKCKGNGRYDGKCVTCTVYGGVFTGNTGLKAALHAAAAAPGDSTKNPVYVGAGTYTFTEADINPDTSSSAQAVYLASPATASGQAVQILACGNGDVTFDGGAAWTSDQANLTKTATGSEWPNAGQGLLYLDYKTPATSNDTAGFVIDGIDFRNARNTVTGSSAGAIYHSTPLTVRNSEISRCYGATGGIAGTRALTATNVSITQCYGADATYAGAIRTQRSGTWENLTVQYNGALIDGVGGILASGSTTVLTLNNSKVDNNAPGGVQSAGTVTCQGTTTIANNTPVNCAESQYDANPTFTGCTCGNTICVLQGRQCNTNADCCSGAGTCQSLGSYSICCVNTVAGSSCPA